MTDSLMSRTDLAVMKKCLKDAQKKKGKTKKGAVTDRPAQKTKPGESTLPEDCRQEGKNKRNEGTSKGL